MQSSAKTVDQYVKELPPERVDAFKKLRETIVKNLPKGFEEEMNYGGAGYVVPHTLYPAGYHCDPKQPVPFAGIASQKHSINFYHIGIYNDPDLLKWFVSQYPKYSNAKLDMGKSCVRFKKFTEIPYELIGELMTKISVEKWIDIYSKMDPRNKK